MNQAEERPPLLAISKKLGSTISYFLYSVTSWLSELNFIIIMSMHLTLERDE